MPITPPLNIISPKLYPNEQWNESEALGAITWLCYQSPTHRQVPIVEMMTYILPVLKKRAVRFVLQGYPTNRLYLMGLF